MNEQEHMDYLRGEQRHCGGFHHALIEAWFKADGGNKRRIEEAFPHDYRIPIGKPPRNGKQIFEDLGWTSEKG
mgnify:FL=1